MSKIEQCFTCPQCGSHTLDEVMIGVIQTSPITVVEATEAGLACDYGTPTFDGGEVCHYECGQCGHIVCEDEEELRKLLKLRTPRKKK